MNDDQIEPFFRSIFDADWEGRDPQTKLFFRAIYIGYEYPYMDCPVGDEVAKRGHSIGTDLRKRFK